MKDCSVSLIERKKERKTQVFGLEKIGSKKANTIFRGSHRQTVYSKGSLIDLPQNGHLIS
jgi:hypothetical protein